VSIAIKSNFSIFREFGLRQGIDGIYVVDQWKADNRTSISIRFIRSMGKDSKGNFFHPCDNAEAFFVIE
jgi:hypothetical protein